MELERETQIELRRLLKQKMNVDRFKARRSWDNLAMELGVSDITLRASIRRGRANGKLTPQELSYAALMRSEYDKHREEFKEWTQGAIAKKLGIHEITVQRWTERVLNEGFSQGGRSDC